MSPAGLVSGAFGLTPPAGTLDCVVEVVDPLSTARGAFGLVVLGALAFAPPLHATVISARPTSPATTAFRGIPLFLVSDVSTSARVRRRRYPTPSAKVNARQILASCLRSTRGATPHPGRGGRRAHRAKPGGRARRPGLPRHMGHDRGRRGHRGRPRASRPRAGGPRPPGRGRRRPLPAHPGAPADVHR